MAVTRMYAATGLTGGANGDLDTIDGQDLADKDMAIVCDQTTIYFYVLDDDSGAAESSPDVISPNDNASNKRWILQSLRVNDLTLSDDIILVADDVTIGGLLSVGETSELKGAVQIGDTDGTGAGLTVYSDTAGDHMVFDKTGKTFTLTDIQLVANSVDINGGAIDGTTIGAASATTIIGTTIDATTDFTIGSLVITDGVITDATGLSIAATTNFNNNAMTNVNIDSGAIDGVTLGGAAQVTITDADINGGTIDGVVIGGATPAAITGTTIDASTDFTVGGTVITDNTLTDDGTFIVEVNNILQVKDEGNDNAELHVGEAGSHVGQIEILGNHAADTTGGSLNIHTADDHDGTGITYFQISVTSDDLNIGPSQLAGALQFIGSGVDATPWGSWKFDAPIDFNNEAMTNVNIDSGAIDNTTVGAGTPSSGNFTNIDATGTLTFDGGGAAVDAWSGSDTTGLTGTAGTAGNPPVWDANGDLVEGPVATAANDFIVATAANTWAKKTLAETGAILEADLDHGNLQGLDTGADHSYIDQDVTSTGTPTFAQVTVDDMVLNARSITFSGAGQTTMTCAAGQNISIESVTFDGGLMTATTIGAFQAVGAIDFNNQAMTNVDINSGAIDGTAIGAASHTTIKGTTIDATTDFTIGSLVITDGVLTDATGLQLAAAVDITGALTVDSVTATTADTNLTLAANGTGVIDINDSWTAAGQTCADLGTVTTANIDGGTLDGVTIGGASSAAATVTTLNVTDITVADTGEITLDSTPASDDTGTGIIVSETVDANASGIGALMVKSADGNWDEADADAVTTVGQLGIALEAGTGTKKILLYGFIKDTAWSWTIGGQMFVSTTAGDMTQTAPSGSGDYVQVCGYAFAANTVFFNPSPDYIEVA